ncbi:MAG: DUF4190 domain-containing protein [Anaerolineaceae bacterium]
MSQQSYNNYPQSVPPQESSTLAIISLISGILGWLGLFGLGGLVAVITGHMAMNEINRSMGRMGGAGMAKAGLILGYLNIALTLVGICLAIILPLLGITLLPICSLPFINQY